MLRFGQLTQIAPVQRMELDDFVLSDEVDVAAAPGNLVMPEWKNLHLLKFMNTNCFLVNAVMFITSILFFHFIV